MLVRHCCLEFCKGTAVIERVIGSRDRTPSCREIWFGKTLSIPLAYEEA